MNQARDDVRRAEVYRRMALAVQSLSVWTVVPFPLTAMTRHADLMRQRLNVGSNELKIAAIALDVSQSLETSSPLKRK